MKLKNILFLKNDININSIVFYNVSIALRCHLILFSKFNRFLKIDFKNSSISTLIFFTTRINETFEIIKWIKSFKFFIFFFILIVHRNNNFMTFDYIEHLHIKGFFIHVWFFCYISFWMTITVVFQFFHFWQFFLLRRWCCFCEKYSLLKNNNTNSYNAINILRVVWKVRLKNFIAIIFMRNIHYKLNNNINLLRNVSSNSTITKSTFSNSTLRKSTFSNSSSSN